MESKAKFLGHPIHPMLIVLPLGLLGTSLAFDIAYFLTENGRWADIAFWMIAAGLIGGLLASIFGLIDWVAIPQRTRAKAIGMWHGIGNLVVLALFAVSLYFRADDPHQPELLALLLSAAGVALALLTGWLGGELVDRLGVGVDPGAHLNSPNSLSGRPATDSVTGSRSVEAPGSARPLP